MSRKANDSVSGFRLIELIGEGEFGEVWRARAKNGMSMALKFIDLFKMQKVQDLAGIHRVKNVRHPNLMPIISIWLLDDDGNVLDDKILREFEDLALAAEQREQGTLQIDTSIPRWLMLAMPPADDDLKSVLSKCGGGGIPPKILFPYLRDVAQGLDFLNSPRHDFGKGPVALYHGDVKPANMMLVGDAIQLSDYGIAHLFGNTNLSSIDAASLPTYVAPECLRDSQIGPSSDQYSLAISYYELRTGKVPFEKPSSYQAVMNAHLQGALELSLLGSNERAVIERATSLSPEDRFSSCHEMLVNLYDASRSPTQSTSPQRLVRPDKEGARDSAEKKSKKKVQEESRQRPPTLLPEQPIKPAKPHKGEHPELSAKPLAHETDFGSPGAPVDDKIAALTEAIRLDPQGSKPYYARACQWINRGEYDKAVTDFKTCIELAEGNNKPYFELGAVCVELQRYEEAVGCLSKAIELNPVHPTSYQARAEAYFGLEKYEDAIRDYSEAISQKATSRLAAPDPFKPVHVQLDAGPTGATDVNPVTEQQRGPIDSVEEAEEPKNWFSRLKSLLGQ